MNREILFRGKPIDKNFGEWVEGFYMEDLNNGRMKFNNNSRTSILFKGNVI